MLKFCLKVRVVGKYCLQLAFTSFDYIFVIKRGETLINRVGSDLLAWDCQILKRQRICQIF